MTATVRRAGPHDLRAAGHLRWRWKGEGSAAAETAFVEDWLAWAAGSSATHTCFVALEDDRVVGLAWLAVAVRVPEPEAVHRATGDVQSVYVEPEARGAGHARRLVAALLEDAWDRGLERVTVHSSEEGTGVYHRAGFRAWPHLMAVSPPPSTEGA